MTVNERIKNRRKELGLHADDVAQALGISRATLYRYESSDIEKLPSKILEPLAEILKTTPASLMGWNGEGHAGALTEGEEREILNILENTREQLLSQDGLMFDGRPASEEAIESILAAMQIGLELAKRKSGIPGKSPKKKG